MKTIIIAQLFVLFTFLGCQSNVITKINNYNEGDFIMALKSDNKGLVESSIFQVVYHHVIGMEIITPKIILELELLKQNGSTERIKKISNIAMNFFNKFDSSLQAEVKCNFYSRGKLFEVIENVLTERKMNANNNHITIEK